MKKKKLQLQFILHKVKRNNFEKNIVTKLSWNCLGKYTDGSIFVIQGTFDELQGDKTIFYLLYSKYLISHLEQLSLYFIYCGINFLFFFK